MTSDVYRTSLHNIKAYYIVLLDDKCVPPMIVERLSGPTTQELANAVIGLYRTGYEKWYKPTQSVEILPEEDVKRLEDYHDKRR